MTVRPPCAKDFINDKHWKHDELSNPLQTRTTTRSCRTRKRAFHFYSPGVVRRSHAAALRVRPAAATAAVYSQYDDLKLIIIN